MSDEFRIAKLEVKPGDVLVAKLNARVSGETIQRARDCWRPFLPEGVKLLIIDCDVDLSILSAAEIDRRSAA